MSFARDTFLIFRRQPRLSLRNPGWVIIGLIQLGLIQLGLFGAAFVGFTIISDWRSGVIERLRVTPVSRLAILAGRVLRDVVTLFVQAVVLVLAGVAFGLRAPLAGVLIGFGFIAVVAVSLAAVSYPVGLPTKSEDGRTPEPGRRYLMPRRRRISSTSPRSSSAAAGAPRFARFATFPDPALTCARPPAAAGAATPWSPACTARDFLPLRRPVSGIPPDTSSIAAATPASTTPDHLSGENTKEPANRTTAELIRVISVTVPVR